MADILKKRKIFSIFFLVTLAVLSGCSDSEKHDKPKFLIKTPAIVISSSEFSEELDLKRAAYPYNIDEDPAEYNEMVIRLVKILSEEMILLNAAADKGVVVSENELASAEAEFKKDYPEDSFDRMLLTSAIPYRLWKKRFKRDMIIDKLVHQELVDKIEITSQDIVNFYNELKGEDDLKDSTETSKETNRRFESENQLVTRLRMQKTQEEYDKWIQDLRNLYPVEINQDALKTFMLELKKQ